MTVAELLMFVVDWCPHCIEALPIWEDIKSQYENKLIHGCKVKFTIINCTYENADADQLADKYNVEGYPTILFLKGNGEFVEFVAKLTKETLMQFLEELDVRWQKRKYAVWMRSLKFLYTANVFCKVAEDVSRYIVQMFL